MYQALNCYMYVHSVYLIFYFNFIYLFLAVLCLRCCGQAFSSCGKQGVLFVVVCRLLTAVASLCCKTQALGMQAQ